jgi:translation initiation factor 2B subunit (eIF-2B alpha/beta/delta family)
MTFGNGRDIERRIGAIASNRRSGASELSRRALDTLATAAPGPRGGARAFARDLQELGARLCALRPGMPAIANAVRGALAGMGQPPRGDPAAGLQRDVARRVRGQKRAMRAAVDSAARHYAARFGRVKHPLVLSNSGSLVAALTTSRCRSVTLCESRPGYEGRRLAASLRRRLSGNVMVTVITEAQAALALNSCDAFVIGCDAVFSDGSVANKVGSALIAAACRRAGVPVIVVGDTWKLASRREYAAEPHPGEEVWNRAPGGVIVRNDYFEVVPAGLVGWIVTEEGVHRPPAVRTLHRKHRRKQRSG